MRNFKKRELKLLSSYVCLNGVRFHAYHGVLPQESRVGGWFTLTLRVGYDISRAMETDCVDDTLNYATLYQIAEREMSVPSRLLEHVAGRIVKAVTETCSQVLSIDLWLTKENPPMGGDMQGAGVELHLINDKTEH